ncbi:MAG: hypothetical protein IBJ07_16925 [Rhizobiaceae bacterium]|nr:hypothetical protein [Rhizobiaceae bacterium]
MIRRAPASRRSGDAGFVLVEALVAVAILAAIGGLVAKHLVDTRQVELRAQNMMKARLVAEAVLANGFDPAGGASQSGSIDGRRWVLDVALDRSAPSREGGAPLGLYDVRVTVEVPGDKPLAILTRRVGRL